MQKIKMVFPHISKEFDNNIFKIKMFYVRGSKSWAIAKYNKDDFQIGNAIYIHSKQRAIDQKKEWEKEYKK
jgi:hypothetical protein